MALIVYEQSLLPLILEKAQKQERGPTRDHVLSIYADCFASAATAHPQASHEIKSLFAGLWAYDTIWADLEKSITGLSDAYADMQLRPEPNASQADHKEQTEADNITLNFLKGQITIGLINMEMQNAEILSLRRDKEYVERLVQFYKEQATGSV
ncbi:hypothetical protein ACEPPN_004789 [Leptodophora sp. 'Broadleaf-Isolate-01']